jgi:hypothetical protein
MKTISRTISTNSNIETTLVRQRLGFVEQVINSNTSVLIKETSSEFELMMNVIENSDTLALQMLLYETVQ